MPGNNITEEELSKMSVEEVAELQKQNCIFCKIANKEIPAKIIHEDADIICILDINPASEGHILVYPKKHYMILPHMPEDILQKVFKNVKLMSHTLLKSLQCKGTTIFIANGAAAGQKAPHVLIHVFPRRENDGLVHLPGYEVSEEQLDKLKIDLGRYIAQIYGQKKPLIKTAEFSEKPKESVEIKTSLNRKEIEKTIDEEEKDKEDIEETSEDEDTVETEQKEKIRSSAKDTKEVTFKKLDPNKKDSKNQDKDKNTGVNTTKNTKKDDDKIDLDDISRLFG